ncbi:hypothetical protein CGCSCA4_v007688 [Colletotrichum siamense]|uniref:Uncharacterized protein n=1 Tax=Colletotrichum siamense TaxID=690259 RepID=A0A9P5ER34_COLSI|nr:hypothetical protein CGCSCA4_v007688 [Colletotrichum siamense]KAF4857891.1 hypothetical protein CGCSCA2_v007941 [Colletotrichum siamense]
MHSYPSKSSSRLSAPADDTAETDTLLGSTDSLSEDVDAEGAWGSERAQTRGNDYDTKVLVATCIIIVVPALTGAFWWFLN